MIDWMVEVCTSFKCRKRTYFLAVRCFDNFLVAMRKKGVVLANKDVHITGEVSIQIRHCLMARKGVKVEDVKRVLSHPENEVTESARAHSYYSSKQVTETC